MGIAIAPKIKVDLGQLSFTGRWIRSILPKGTVMEILTINQVQAQLEGLLLKVQHNPIAISRNGEPIAVIISMTDYSVLEQLKLQQLQQKIKRSEADVAAGRVHDGDEFLQFLIADKTK